MTTAAVGHVNEAGAPLRGPRLPRSHRRSYIQHLLSLHIQRLAERHLADRDDRVLVDFGCGDMPYRAVFEPFVSQYIGADMPDNREATALLRNDGSLDLPDATADVMLSTQVLEHVPSPAAYLAECRRVLRGEGLLLLSTHGLWWYHPHPTDYWRWTGEGLNRELNEAGFDVIDREGLMGLAAAGLSLVQDGVYRALPRWTRPTFYTLVQLGARGLDRLTRPDDRQHNAAVFIVMARRRP